MRYVGIVIILPGPSQVYQLLYPVKPSPPKQHDDARTDHDDSLDGHEGRLCLGVGLHIDDTLWG